MITETGNKKGPLVSICIPAYNNQDYILETMDSVIDQTYNDIELIVVDDCSKDETFEVISKQKDYYENELKTDKVIKVFRNDTNLGMVGNWNRCLELCSGKYIKLICADDLLSKDATEKEVSILEEDPDVLCVSSDTQFIGADGAEKGKYKRYRKTGKIEGKEAVLFSFFTRDYLGAPLANLFRKSVYEDIGGFDKAFNFILDYDFFVRIYLHGKVFIVHECLNYFRIRRDSNTGSVMGGDKDELYIREHEQLILKYKEILGLKKWQVSLSIFIRKVMSFLGSIYIKISLAK